MAILFLDSPEARSLASLSATHILSWLLLRVGFALDTDKRLARAIFQNPSAPRARRKIACRPVEVRVSRGGFVETVKYRTSVTEDEEEKRS